MARFQCPEDAANSSLQGSLTSIDVDPQVTMTRRGMGEVLNDTISGKDLRDVGKLQNFLDKASSDVFSATVEAAATYTKIILTPTIDLTWDVHSDEAASSSL